MIVARPWRAFALLLAVAALARVQTFGNPVTGFDEQFYLLAGERLLAGTLPYVDIFDRKPIGLFLIFASLSASGGDPLPVVQAAAALTVAATGFVIARTAARFAPPLGALAAGIAYILWLNLTEGEGYQAEIWFNLPVALAAMIVSRPLAAAQRARLAEGAAAMLLIGLALQIKYSVVFEGLFLGLALLWTVRGAHPARIAACALLWAGTALLPTIAAAASYAALGHFDAWSFANISSTLGKLPDPVAVKLRGLGLMALIAAPLALAAIGTAAPRFATLWLASAAGGVLIFGAYGPHYLMPVLVPLCILAAPRLAAARWALPLLALGAIGGQVALALTYAGKGGRGEALAVAAAARPAGGGCLWVHDGYPALYRMTVSCLPTRYVFPGHLNTANEASAGALGVDPQDEVRRILAARPETIVDTWPRYRLGNPATAALVDAALSRDYARVATIRTGGGRERRVYRRRTGTQGDVRF